MTFNIDILNKMYFSIIALIYLILLASIFISKKKVKTIENYVYSMMLITMIFQLITNILCFATVNSLLSEILKKTYNALFMIWGCEMTYYLFITLSPKNQGYVSVKDNPEKLYFMKIANKFIILAICLTISTYILPMTPTDGLYYTSKGPSPIACYIFFVFFLLSWFFMFIFIKNDSIKSKVRLLLLSLLFSTIGPILQIIFPTLYVTSAGTALATILIYFTIGNPDFKLIEELNMSKDSSLRAENAKSDFLSSMSHEIRTPLNAIVGFSQSLLEENMSDDNKEDVKTITGSAVSLLEIVNGILDISKLDANKLEIVNQEYILNRLLNDVISTSKTYMNNKNINLKINVSPKVPQVLYGDYVKIKEILTNLVTNAIKYTEEGYVLLNVDCITKNDECRLLIFVEDSGVGIREDTLTNLFNIYQKEDVEKRDKIEGSGLGVALTKKLIELLGSKIFVKSKVGEGTIFTFGLTQKVIAQTSREEIKLYSDEDTIFNGSGKRIMVVDDNTVNLKVAKRLLKIYNFDDIELISSGSDCIERIKLGEKYDLIMMDDFMPKMSGAQTLENLKQIPGFNIPVIALTANNESNSKEKYMSLGFNGYLAKPIVKEELNVVLKKYLN